MCRKWKGLPFCSINTRLVKVHSFREYLLSRVKSNMLPELSHLTHWYALEFETKGYALYSLLLLLWWLLSYTNFKRVYFIFHYFGHFVTLISWSWHSLYLINNLLVLEISESVLVLKGPQGRINRAVWGPLNKTIISAGEDAVIRIWDAEVR